MKKRLCSFILFLCFLTVSLGGISEYANAEDLTEKTVYAAFGDSIAAGYGLPGYSKDQAVSPADSYQTLLGNFLHTQACNYAVSGNDSNDCIQLLNSSAADADLKHADVISLSIGSNDLLLPFIDIALDYFDIDPEKLEELGKLIEAGSADGFDLSQNLSQIDLAQLLKYSQQAEQLMDSLADNALLHERARNFPQQLEKILSILHQKAPRAEIYVTNIYNPFHSVPRLGDLAEIYINEINQAFSADAPDYTLIDVYTPFGQDELTNVNFDLNNSGNINPDPHPSAEGHKTIAELFIQALKQANAPKAAALTSVSSSSKYKLTAKIRLPDSADGCQIRYAASKNGTYQTLAKTAKKKYQTNSRKLKAGKTYYIKLRSFHTIKGVTYYGKNSSAKKIKIV